MIGEVCGDALGRVVGVVGYSSRGSRIISSRGGLILRGVALNVSTAQTVNRPGRLANNSNERVSRVPLD